MLIKFLRNFINKCVFSWNYLLVHFCDSNLKARGVKMRSLRNLFVVTLFSLICLFKSTECSLNCTNTSQCTCYSPFLDRYEYHCPPNSYAKGGFVMHIRDMERLRIDGYNVEQFDLDLLPQWYGMKFRYVEIRFSPLPYDNFRQIFEKLTDIKSVEFLGYRYTTTSNLTLQQRYFDGFEHLKVLDLSSNSFTDFDDDVFGQLPNLIYLNLENNQLELKSKLLQNQTNLVRLDLSSNQLVTIPDDFFSNLKQLKLLSLWNNHLTHINNNDFQRLHNLLSLDLYANQIEHIDNNAFADLVNLKNLSLNTNNLQRLPLDLFENNSNLELLKLGSNPLTVLPIELFANLTKLRILDLSNCSLNYLPNFEGFNRIEEIDLSNNQLKILTPLPQLKHLIALNLHNNAIQILKNDVLKQLRDLQKLDLSRNRIEQIEVDSFIKNHKLISINLAHNNYTLNLREDNPFDFCEYLEELDLSYNRIEQVDSLLIASLLRLKKLNLKHNRIRQVSIDLFLTPSDDSVFMDLSYNQIETVLLNRAPTSEINQRIYTTVNFRHNPFNCDCRMDSIWKYFQNKIDPSIKYTIHLKEEDFICTEPLPYRNTTINQLKSYMLVCPLQKVQAINCPDECLCDWRSIDQTIIIDCTNQNLVNWPELQLPSYDDLQFKEIEVHLEHNNLTDLTLEQIPYSYENITKLYLAQNNIENINWLPANLKVLDLSNNSMNRLDSTILEKFTQIHNLSLDNNPWICDCAAVDFSNFLRSNLDKLNPTNIQCKDTSRLVDLNRNDLCKTKLIIIYACVVFLIVFLLISIIIAFYYRYQQEIKVWLYARNWCLWWVTEDELDKDKIYDAFISYSNEDDLFVMENLVPILEKDHYELCLHKRNFIPGEFITKQIIKSVQESRRTIVVLSSNFLKSTWGKMEFRTAHTQAMNEGRVRVIVVLLGDIDVNQLDDEMKTYLKTNTYVQWGNPHFWDQLRYALPHRNKRLDIDRDKRQKHMKMMLKIDEKFNLKPTFTQNPDSTPPVVALDVSLLKKHPLNLTNAIQPTTPAEC